jgi:hypothetical protein
MTKKYGRLTTITAPPAARLRMAREAIRSAIERGVEVNLSEIARRHGIPRLNAREALLIEQGRRESVGNTEDPDHLSASARERYDRAVAAAIRRLEAEYEDRRQQELQRIIDTELLPHYREKERRADRIIGAARNGVFTNEEYRLVLSCLSPDSRGSVSEERLARAFNLFKENEQFLSKREAMPQPSTLPSSFADLIARRAAGRRNTTRTVVPRG